LTFMNYQSPVGMGNKDGIVTIVKAARTRFIKLSGLLCIVLNQRACISTVVGIVVDVLVEVAKVSLKVGAAVVDVITEED
jgi:hypothetical protein